MTPLFMITIQNQVATIEFASGTVLIGGVVLLVL